MHLARSSTRPACHPTRAQVLLLDVDVLVLRPHALLRLFAPLGDYDLGLPDVITPRLRSRA